MADALGLPLDEVRCDTEYAQTTEDLDLGTWSIPAGCVAGVAASWKGIHAGKVVVDLRVRWRKGRTLEPDWPIEHGYVVEVQGRPHGPDHARGVPPAGLRGHVVRRLHGARDDHDGDAGGQRDPPGLRRARPAS